MVTISNTTYIAKETEDPYVVIELKTDSSTTYRNIKSDERWIIYGKCNCCGQCEVGAVNPNIVWTGITAGEPNAEYDVLFDKRKDIPVRPELTVKCSKCTLKGEYL